MKNQKRSKKIIHIPDEVVMEILKLVPVIDVLKFGRICRRWRELISTQHFKDMHVKSCSPSMVLVDTKGRMDRRYDIYLLQNIWDTAPKKLTIDKKLVPSPPLMFTYEGLIVFYDRYSSSGNFIFNPISGEKFTISRPVGSGFSMFGMFFNIFIKKYCVLWGSFWRGKVEFKILILGVEESFRDLKPPNLLIKKPNFPPVVIDNATLYWLRMFAGSCEKVIMAFDTKNEEFSLMPHPDCTKSCRKFSHTNMRLVKISGCLSFVELRCEESLIVNMWTLKDSVNRIWVKTHRVSFGNLDRITSIRMEGYLYRKVDVLTAEDAELFLLALPWCSRSGERLYACNLKDGTVRKIGEGYHYTAKFCMYVPSFASPSNGRQNTQI